MKDSGDAINLFAVFNRHRHVLPALAVFQCVKFLLLFVQLLKREGEQTPGVDEPAVELVLRCRQLLEKRHLIDIDIIENVVIDINIYENLLVAVDINIGIFKTSSSIWISIFSQIFSKTAY